MALIGDMKYLKIGDAVYEIPSSTVPTNVSAFTNDAGYITSADVPEGSSAYTGTIQPISTVASNGTNNGFARGDHVHNITSNTITSALGYTPASTYTAGDGIDITNGTISVDSNLTVSGDTAYLQYAQPVVMPIFQTLNAIGTSTTVPAYGGATIRSYFTNISGYTPVAIMNFNYETNGSIIIQSQFINEDRVSCYVVPAVPSTSVAITGSTVKLLCVKNEYLQS